MEDSLPVSRTHWTGSGVVVICLGSVIALANFTVLFGVLRKHLQRARGFAKLTGVDWFVVNICVADFLFGLLSTVALLMSRGDLRNSRAATNVAIFSGFAGSASTFLLFGLALTRYLLVRRHTAAADKGFIQETETHKWIACLWFVVACLAIGFVAAGTPAPAIHGLSSNLSELVPGSAITVFTQTHALVSTVLPIVGIFWFYYRIIQEVKHDVVDPALTRKIANMFALLNLVYTISILPLGSVYIHGLITGGTLRMELQRAFYMLVFLNFLANPLIYCVCQKKYRKAVLDLPFLRYPANALGLLPQQTSASAPASSSPKRSHSHASTHKSRTATTQTDCPAPMLEEHSNLEEDSREPACAVEVQMHANVESSQLEPSESAEASSSKIANDV